MTTAPTTVDEYVARLSPESRAAVSAIREVIRRAVPGVTERISYGIATFDLDGTAFVHVAGWKAHVSLYPTPQGDPELDAALAPYLAGASTTKFPLSAGVPLDLVERAVRALASRRA